MSDNWFEKLKSEVKTFFENATENEINQALEEAGYSFYKNVDYPIIDFHDMFMACESRGTVLFAQSLKRNYALSGQITTKHLISFEENSLLVSDNYGYALAA